jgi:hypothetical protein
MPPVETDSPDIARILGQLLQRVSHAERPLLIAIAERLAADRYRAWAGDLDDPARRSQLLACAEREEEIARRVEALFPDAATIQRDILARNPDLGNVNRCSSRGARSLSSSPSRPRASASVRPRGGRSPATRAKRAHATHTSPAPTWRRRTPPASKRFRAKKGDARCRMPHRPLLHLRRERVRHLPGFRGHPRWID